MDRKEEVMQDNNERTRMCGIHWLLGVVEIDENGRVTRCLQIEEGHDKQRKE